VKLIPYINLTGNAEEAMNFYQSIFGGTTEVMRWRDMPPDPKMPLDDAWKSKVMHATLTIRDEVSLFLSDSLIDEKAPKSNNVVIHIEFDSEDELRNVYNALSDGGRINMPVDRMFWGAVYGDLVDRFGVGWGLHYQLPDERS